MSQEEFIKRATKTVAKQKIVYENDIEDSYCEHAKKRSCLAIKLVLLRRAGFPDRTTLCPRGRVLFIEFKRKRKKSIRNQPKWRKILEGFGFEYYICDEIGQAEEILDRFLER